MSEGIDYRVDYNLGKVNIINQSVLNSGKPIQIKYEKADLFNFQARTLLGSRLDYIHNDKFNIGGTILYLNERPLVSRISVGDETIRNTKWGLDMNYRTESNFLTKLVDAIPGISTKEPSMVSFNAEVAQLLPGTSNIVDGQGTSYIDDFESAITPFRLGGNMLSWTDPSAILIPGRIISVEDPPVTVPISTNLFCLATSSASAFVVVYKVSYTYFSFSACSSG